MATITGVEKLRRQLFERLRRAGVASEPKVSGTVGYTAEYALWVHENLEAVHPVGNAKFLSRPAVRLRRELVRIVRETVARGGTFRQGVLLSCLTLQRASQEEVPVDTGALRASAFTEIKEGR